MGVFCQIHVEKPAQGYFLPGSPVTGTIKYFLNKDKAFHSIILSLKGRGFSQFTHREQHPHHHHQYGNNHHNGPHNVSYTVQGTDFYVNLQSQVYTGETGVVAAGEYTAPFNFILPYNIPPSFLHETLDYSARINYYVSMKFSEPGRFTRAKKFKKEIFVASGVIPSIPMGPATYQLQKKLTNLFSSKKNEVNLQVTINQSVVNQGGAIQLSYVIENNTKLDIPKLKTNILRVEVLRSDCGRMKLYEKILAEKTETLPIGRGVSATLEGNLQLPIDAYTIQNSRVISREYKLIAKVKLPGFHRDAIMAMPLVIGQIVSAVVPVNPVYVPPPTQDEPPSYWEAMEEDTKK